MDDEQFRYVSAALNLHEFLLMTLLDGLTQRRSDAEMQAHLDGMRKRLMALRLPPGVPADEPTLATQREMLRQFDRMAREFREARGAGTPVA